MSPVEALGGRLYDPLTMNEVVTGVKTRAPYWWEVSVLRP